MVFSPKNHKGVQNMPRQLSSSSVSLQPFTLGLSGFSEPPFMFGVSDSDTSSKGDQDTQVLKAVQTTFPSVPVPVLQAALISIKIELEKELGSACDIYDTAAGAQTNDAKRQQAINAAVPMLQGMMSLPADKTCLYYAIAGVLAYEHFKQTLSEDAQVQLPDTLCAKAGITRDELRSFYGKKIESVNEHRPFASQATLEETLPSLMDSDDPCQLLTNIIKEKNDVSENIAAELAGIMLHQETLRRVQSQEVINPKFSHSIREHRQELLNKVLNPFERFVEIKQVRERDHGFKTLAGYLDDDIKRLSSEGFKQYQTIEEAKESDAIGLAGYVKETAKAQKVVNDPELNKLIIAVIYGYHLFMREHGRYSKEEKETYYTFPQPKNDPFKGVWPKGFELANFMAHLRLAYDATADNKDGSMFEVIKRYAPQLAQARGGDQHDNTNMLALFVGYHLADKFAHNSPLWCSSSTVENPTLIMDYPFARYGYSYKQATALEKATQAFISHLKTTTTFSGDEIKKKAEQYVDTSLTILAKDPNARIQLLEEAREKNADIYATVSEYAMPASYMLQVEGSQEIYELAEGGAEQPMYDTATLEREAVLAQPMYDTATLERDHEENLPIYDAATLDRGEAESFYTFGGAAEEGGFGFDRVHENGAYLDVDDKDSGTLPKPQQRVKKIDEELIYDVGANLFQKDNKESVVDGSLYTSASTVRDKKRQVTIVKAGRKREFVELPGMVFDSGESEDFNTEDPNYLVVLPDDEGHGSEGSVGSQEETPPKKTAGRASPALIRNPQLQLLNDSDADTGNDSIDSDDHEIYAQPTVKLTNGYRQVVPKDIKDFVESMYRAVVQANLYGALPGSVSAGSVVFQMLPEENTKDVAAAAWCCTCACWSTYKGWWNSDDKRVRYATRGITIAALLVLAAGGVGAAMSMGGGGGGGGNVAGPPGIGGSGKTTLSPTRAPTGVPTSAPTGVPTGTPTLAPTGQPTKAPVLGPTTSPTKVPTGTPTQTPTNIPTGVPTGVPTGIPTNAPTNIPTGVPTGVPTGTPTQTPTNIPTGVPTGVPTGAPTNAPTNIPTGAPTGVPTNQPTGMPTLFPTRAPTGVPTTPAPTGPPTTAAPTGTPTLAPTGSPTTPAPTATPTTAAPTLFPTTAQPTKEPTQPPVTPCGSVTECDDCSKFCAPGEPRANCIGILC